MKNKLVVLLFFIICNHVKAQIPDTSCNIIASIDSTFFFCDSSSSSAFTIENTLNNIWQIGPSLKFGNLVYRDSMCGIITDSINPYPVNNLSAFYFILPERYQGDHFYNYYLKFWHRFETDSLYDGGWLEFSIDTGQTWHKIDTSSLFFHNYFQNGYDVCNLYGVSNSSSLQSMDTLVDGTKAWTGNSNGWIYTALWLNVAFPINKRWTNDVINAVRFVYRSDSIHNPRNGWTINEINTGVVWIANSLEEVASRNTVNIYPNPSSDGRYTISYSTFKKSDFITVYDMLGHVILSRPLSNNIDLSKQQDGLYYYKINLNTVNYFGTLLKQ